MILHVYMYPQCIIVTMLYILHVNKHWNMNLMPTVVVITIHN